jgi:hypothetical protein
MLVVSGTISAHAQERQPCCITAQKAMDGGAIISKDGVTEKCSCIFRTSYVHVGRMLVVSGTISAHVQGWTAMFTLWRKEPWMAVQFLKLN